MALAPHTLTLPRTLANALAPLTRDYQRQIEATDRQIGALVYEL